MIRAKLLTMPQSFVDFIGNYVLGNELFLQCGQLFILLSIFLWLSGIFKKRLSSDYFSDTISVMILLGIYTLYKLAIYAPFRSLEVRDYDYATLFSLLISSLLMTQAYFFLRPALIKTNHSFRRRESYRFFLLTVLVFAHAYLTQYLSKLIQEWRKGGPLDNAAAPVPHDIWLIGLYFTISFALIFATVNLALNQIRHRGAQRYRRKDLELERMKNQLLQSQLDSLQARINPHFLYNSLNSIAALTYEDPARSRKMAIALSHLLRHHVNREQQHLSTVEEEIEMAELYLEIEKIRFGDRLSFHFDINEHVKKIPIPRFVLQPLLENAIKHGFAGVTADLNISIIAKHKGHGLELIVRDNGLPFEEKFTPGYGFKSIYEKLDILYPGRYELHISKHPQKEIVIYLKSKA